MQLHFAVPESSDAHAGYVETRPDQVAAWLARLSGETEGDALGAVCAALASLNRVPVADDTRIDLAEQYREALAGWVARLRARLASAAFPLDSELHALAGHARGALGELALTYRLLLNRHAAQRGAARRQGVRLLRGALATMAGEALLHYETYTDLPAGFWRDFHRLFAYARHLGADAEDPNIAHGPGVEDSPEQTYRQGLLLAMADPYRMESGAAAQALELIRSLAPRALLHGRAGSVPRGQFAIEADADRPVQVRGATRGALPGDLTLDTEPVRLAFEMLLMRARTGETGVGRLRSRGDAALLARLIQGLASPARRRYARHDGTGASAALCSGLRGLQDYLEGRADEPPRAPVGQTGDATHALTQGAPVEVKAPLLSRWSHAGAQRWQVDNASAEGFALKGRELTPGQVRVGELVGVLLDDAAGISLGLVRWMRASGPGCLDLGVQLIAPRVVPVTLLAEGLQEQPALRVPAVRDIGLPPLLIAPRGSWRAPGRVRLRERGEINEAEAVRLVEQTASVDVVEIES
jgi:hypothetical protein